MKIYVSRILGIFALLLHRQFNVKSTQIQGGEWTPLFMQGVPARQEDIPQAPPPVPYQPSFPDFQQQQQQQQQQYATNIPQQSQTINYAQITQPFEHPTTANIPPIFSGNLIAFNEDFLNTQQQPLPPTNHNNFNTVANQQNENYIQGYGNGASFNNDGYTAPLANQQLDGNNQSPIVPIYGGSNAFNNNGVNQPASKPSYVQQDTVLNYGNQFSQQNFPYATVTSQPAPIFQNQQDENAVTGNPQITCGEHSIGITVPMKHAYSGRIYVNGMSDQPNCIRRYNGQTALATFEIPIAQCNMMAERVPSQGTQYTSPVIVSFHQELLTEQDRVFQVACRYYQSDKPIASFVEVGLLPTVVVSSQFPMPDCRYTLHLRDNNGPLAQFAKVGDPVVHIWQCDSDIYAIKVKNCFVEDGKSRRYLLIDENGCSSDDTILGDIVYAPSLNSASVSTHVFKFADRPHVYFTCELALCLKDDPDCASLTPPHCLSNRVSFHRKRRSILNSTNSNNENITLTSDNMPRLPISSPYMYVIDVSDAEKFDTYVREMASHTQQNAVCLSPVIFASIILSNVITLTFSTFLFIRCTRQPKVRLYQ